MKLSRAGLSAAEVRVHLLAIAYPAMPARGVFPSRSISHDIRYSYTYTSARNRRIRTFSRETSQRSRSARLACSMQLAQKLVLVAPASLSATLFYQHCTGDLSFLHVDSVHFKSLTRFQLNNLGSHFAACLLCNRGARMLRRGRTWIVTN